MLSCCCVSKVKTSNELWKFIPRLAI